MPTPSPTTPSGRFEMSIEEMKLKNEDSEGDDGWSTIKVEEAGTEVNGRSNTCSPVKGEGKSSTQSSKKRSPSSPSPSMAKDEHEEILGGEITVKMEPGQPPKLARSSTQKVVARSAPLFGHLLDKTVEATSHFQLMSACTYSTKYLGYTEHAMECDCAEEWDAATKINHACGEESDCINRATKMECFGDCGCGASCQNQRFQRQQYANVSVIQTEKKGYGLRTDTDLLPNDFIFEYLGEVIHEGQFRKRMRQYDEEGIKHFYFMSLTKGEFVDATKKGNLGRFCNHSCNPNCYVDKWVVGDKLRMGIFAERKIKAGEELVFNYNVDRYGADPQPCYCGEPNCTGFIGGKTQTERATKLSNATIEALGIDDGDGWDTAVAKKPRKKKSGEDDEEYVNNVQPKSLDEDGVTKVMATLMQCKEKWIAVKLLGRIQRSDDEKVISRVVKMHGYQILSSVLATWKEDFNVVLQVLDILNHFPRLTKNKISDSKIEATVSSLESCGDERVEAQATALLQEWSTLETAYRIPRKKRDPNATAETTPNHYDRRGEERKRRSRTRSRSRSRSRSLDAPRGPAAPTGPRSNMPQRYHGPRPPFRPPRPNFMSLPQGWFAAADNGRTYYYSAAGETTWTKPTQPAAQPPPPPKPNSANKALDDIINEITSAKPKAVEKKSASATPKQNGEKEKSEKSEKKESWRNLSEEKQKRLYENTLFPHIKHVVDKYRHKIPKDNLKKFGKEIAKKVVNSDYKNKRVENPTKISEKQEKQVKKFVKEFLDKAAAKSQMRQPSKTEKDAKSDTKEAAPATIHGDIKMVKKEEEDDGDVSMKMQDDEDIKDELKSASPITPVDQIQNGEGLKRKRKDEANENGVEIEEGATPSKRVRSITPPTPPPPPPPASDMLEDQSLVDELDASEAESSPQSMGGDMSIPNPPPPPPPLTPSMDEKLQNRETFTRNGVMSLSFDPEMTPGSAHDSVSDEQDDELGGMHSSQSQYLEASSG